MSKDKKETLNHKVLFKVSMIYTIIVAFIMVVTLLCIDYYESGTHFSNYIFYSVGGSIVITSLVTTISGWTIHSKKERVVLILLHLAMVFVGICILLDQLIGPIWGVIGYSSMYLLIAIYWMAAMYFFGVIGKKYISEKKFNEIQNTQQLKLMKKQKRIERKAAK